jgi:hypothetical protein
MAISALLYPQAPTTLEPDQTQHGEQNPNSRLAHARLGSFPAIDVHVSIALQDFLLFGTEHVFLGGGFHGQVSGGSREDPVREAFPQDLLPRGVARTREQRRLRLLEGDGRGVLPGRDLGIGRRNPRRVREGKQDTAGMEGDQILPPLPILHDAHRIGTCQFVESHAFAGLEITTRQCPGAIQLEKGPYSGRRDHELVEVVLQENETRPIRDRHDHRNGVPIRAEDCQIGCA